MKRFSRYGKKNKYNAKRSRCALGHDHRSGLESEYCFQLQMFERAGDIISFEFEKRFHLEVNGIRICDILPDFFIHFANGVDAIHETKGIETDVWRVKWKLLKVLYPQYDYEVVK